jgi:hypothetical protein
MVLHVIAIGAVVLLGRAVNAGLEAHDRKKQARALQESLTSDSNVPKGYAPQPALLFDYPLLPGETLVATFEFTPAKWVRKLFSSDEVILNSLGSTMGIGHITSQRVLLFYDLKKMRGQSTWSGGQVHTFGKYGSKSSATCTEWVRMRDRVASLTYSQARSSNTV